MLCLHPINSNIPLMLFAMLFIRYWDTRQANPVHIQQLPERCYALTVNYPLMIVGTADRHLVVFNLQNPQVNNVLLNWAMHVLFQFELGIESLMMASFFKWLISWLLFGLLDGVQAYPITTKIPDTVPCCIP